MKKRVIALLLTLVCGMTALSGCGAGKADPSGAQAAGGSGSAGTETGTQEGGQAAADDLSQARTITAWLYPDDYKYYSSYNENPVVQYLNEKFNCTLEFQQPPMGSEQDQFNLMLGTGEYTDIFEISYSQDTTAVLFEDGIIRDLAPYLESYMPNFYKFIHEPENEDVYKALYDEDGHLFTIPSDVKDDKVITWGGLVYRRDILETMTGGNVSFPSGKEDPETVEDWEYMLGLMKQYFEAAGITDYACLIIPSNGYFQTGELVNGFGAAGTYYVVDDKVLYGPTTQEFYHYLVKMHEWYENGWIYQDFASRTNDLFYLPNTSLTYGGAAGAWFGMSSQLEGQMSMPEYNLIMDVRGTAAPLDTANGQDGSKSGSLTLIGDRANSNSGGWVVSSLCSEENMIRFLTVADFLFTEEGAMLKGYGLDAEHGAADNPVYQANNITEGSYYFDESGHFRWHDLLDSQKTEEALDNGSLKGMRLPGLSLNSYENSVAADYTVAADAEWQKYGTGNNFPSSAVATAQESSTLTSAYTNYTDYLDTMVPKFIMGTEELNEDTFATFVDQMNSLGVEECTRIQQEIYDRYNNK